jgi:hypothetical protein
MEDDVFYYWRGRTLQLLKKDRNLSKQPKFVFCFSIQCLFLIRVLFVAGPHAWNAQQLIDFNSKEVVWDAETDAVSDYDSIIAAAQRLELTSPSRVKMNQRESEYSSNEESFLSERSQWTISISADGVLSRDGDLGDLVAWKIEHEGKVIMTRNAHNSTTFQYSKDLPFVAWSSSLP